MAGLALPGDRRLLITWDAANQSPTPTPADTEALDRSFLGS